MKLDDLILRCYAEQDQDGDWFTMCIDLNLYARGDSFDEARQKLHGFIKQYIKDALTKDSAFIGDLIPRKAPLHFILRYYFIWLVCTVKGFRDAAEDVHRCLFNEPFPVTVSA